MRAIGYEKSLPVEDSDSLQDIDLPTPVPGRRDLLVEVRAISVNPADTKVRQWLPPESGFKVIGYDAAGVVREVGSEVTLFQPGDEVYYAGDITRPGTNAELHLVDERIVGKKPATLSFAEAAALPLTSITAWEILFDRLQIPQGKNHERKTMLIIGAAGGVGSIMVQLLRTLTDVTIIGTASRKESADWLLKLGAHHVINHRQPLSTELQAIGIPEVDYVISLTNTGDHYEEIVKVIAPQGHFVLIDDPSQLDAMPLKTKSVSLHWEFMFTRPMFQTRDMVEQHNLLDRVSELIDSGAIRTTVAHHLGAINAVNLRRAHAMLEAQQAHGKIVLEAF